MHLQVEYEIGSWPNYFASYLSSIQNDASLWFMSSPWETSFPLGKDIHSQKRVPHIERLKLKILGFYTFKVNDKRLKHFLNFPKHAEESTNLVGLLNYYNWSYYSLYVCILFWTLFFFLSPSLFYWDSKSWFYFKISFPLIFSYFI